MNLLHSLGGVWSARIQRLGIILLMLTAAQTQLASAFGGEPCDSCVGKPRIGIRQSPCCPDDHCPKPLPCVCDVPACCPDTFCRKPCLVLPCPTKARCPDDYCRKSIPKTCSSPYSHWYKCVPLGPWSACYPQVCED